jgi:hypothetical protein
MRLECLSEEYHGSMALSSDNSLDNSYGKFCSRPPTVPTIFARLQLAATDYQDCVPGPKGQGTTGNRA